MEMYTLSSQTIYDSFSQCYKNVYTVDREPKGKLSTITRRINPPKVSPFKVNNYDNCYEPCLWVILNPHNPCEYLCMSKLPILFSFLTSNGYTIDTKLTSMMNKSQVEFQQKFICFINYSI